MLRAGLSPRQAIAVALAADTVSILTMEITVNRALIGRGRGHAVMHAFHQHH